jgi:ribonuclease HI
VQVVVHVDGGARGNPGPAAAAAVVSTPEGRVLDEASITLGRATNNVAEYRGLLLGLERAAALGASEVDVVNDSELVARQVDGSYKVKNADLRPLHEQATRALAGFERWSIRSVPRAENAAADALVNRALDDETITPAAQPPDDGSDHLLTARQADALWLKLIAHELTAARMELEDGRPDAAAPRLRRVVAVERELPSAPPDEIERLSGALYEAFSRALELPEDREQRRAALAALRADPARAAWHEVAELLREHEHRSGELGDIPPAL